MNRYYHTLGIDINSSIDEIKTRYRKLCLLYHPDKNMVVDTSEEFIQINEAYQVIMDSIDRKEIDYKKILSISSEGYLLILLWCMVYRIEVEEFFSYHYTSKCIDEIIEILDQHEVFYPRDCEFLYNNFQHLYHLFFYLERLGYLDLQQKFISCLERISKRIKHYDENNFDEKGKLIIYESQLHLHQILSYGLIFPSPYLGAEERKMEEIKEKIFKNVPLLTIRYHERSSLVEECQKKLKIYKMDEEKKRILLSGYHIIINGGKKKIIERIIFHLL